jgi:cellulose biosynthesis protein BcsQ
MTGQLTTFYSYKGGVGRTFLLANVAWLLARWGRRVLCLDWDLEAPGLFRYLAPEAPAREGVLDLVLGASRSPSSGPSWRELVHEVNGPWNAGAALHLIGAGKRDADFVRRVQGVHWNELSAHGLETAIERMRAEWVKDYQHVLIDSRTGITDAGGICAAQLPDLLVVTFTASHQSLEGAVDVANMARKARATMPLDRGGFEVLPVPCRIHTGEEEALEKEWSSLFESHLAQLLSPWKDRSVATREYVAHLTIREQARWSFGEQLPVRSEALDDPNRISFAFANVAALVDRRLDQSGAIVRNRYDYIERIAGSSGFSPPGAVIDADYDVFISYPRKEIDAARELSHLLREKGANVFFDQDLAAGAKWSEALYRARERSRMFLVLLSEYDLGPGQTDELLHIARRTSERGITAVPIFLSKAAMARAPSTFADLFGLILPEDGPWERVAEKIASRLGLPENVRPGLASNTAVKASKGPSNKKKRRPMERPQEKSTAKRSASRKAAAKVSRK